MQRFLVKRFGEALAGLLLAALLIVSAAAGTFDELVVFGDSLSDVGNIAQATFGIYPNSYYYEDRFSNGPVYAEYLAAGLGLPALLHSRAGGTNYAYGSALTSGTAFPNNLVVRDVDDQVDQYLASHSAGAGSLFLFLAGANDLVGGVNFNTAAGNLIDDVERLISAGASQFLVLNLPLLGYTPRYNPNPTALAEYNARTRQFNTALADELADVRANNPAVSLWTFDVAELFTQMLASPDAFGFTNVTDPAAPGLQAGPETYDTQAIVSNPEEYLFWDDFHPTAAAHALLGDRLLDLFAAPGDFNRDGLVDAADYVFWRAGAGTRFDEDGYLIWRANFGQSTAAQVEHVSMPNVPEPMSVEVVVALLIGIALVGSGRTRCNRRV